MVVYSPRGGSHAYEIKTGRDSLARLGRQVTAYQRAYPKVTVVTTPERVPVVAQDVPPQVGISVLAPAAGERLGVLQVRPAQWYTEKLDADVMTAHLRTAEAVQAVTELGREPSSSGYRWSQNRAIIAEYDAVEVAEVVSRVICYNRILKPHQVDLLGRVPVALAARVVKFGVNKVQGRRLVQGLGSTGPE